MGGRLSLAQALALPLCAQGLATGAAAQVGYAASFAGRQPIMGAREALVDWDAPGWRELDAGSRSRCGRAAAA